MILKQLCSERRTDNLRYVPAIHGREGLQIIDLQGLEMFQAFKSRISARLGIEPASVQEVVMLQLVQ